MSERRAPRTILRGGRLIDPSSDVDKRADLVLDEGRVVHIADAGAANADGAEVLDADGCWVLPGAIDLCTFARAPGREEEEDLETTLAAAARGGYASVLAMPSTDPVVDGGDDVRERLAAADAAGGARLLVAGCLSRGARGEELAEIGEMSAAGALAFTDAPSAVADAELMRRAMEYTTGFGRPVLAWGACPALSGSGVVAEGAVATRLGLAGIPEAAEVTWVSRHVELCRLTGARVHLSAISAARSVELVRRARDEGVAVSASVLPTHLLLDESAHLERRYDPALRLSPPLRTPADREALLAGVREGLLGIASGHAPVGPTGKSVEFSRAEAGAVALQTTLPVLLGEDTPAGLSPAAVVRATSTGPAEVLGLEDRGHLRPGARADVTVVDPRVRGVVDGELLGTPARNTPLMGLPTSSSVRWTLVDGETRWRS
jgi:dihydroorotase